jgi:hypothetical protein
LDDRVAAHQRKIREYYQQVEPRRAAADLIGYAIETISRQDAMQLILRYEWLGTIGSATHFIGLLSPTREIEGVACFGYGPAGNIRQLIGAPALCLERGACVHYAPRNAASFLINGACKLVYRITGAGLFFAYADPTAGEYGGVYQAAGWAYIGQGLDGKKGRGRRYKVLPPGADPDDPAAWKPSRELRRDKYRTGEIPEGRTKPRGLSFEQARAEGWRIGYIDAKHVYATNVGRTRRAWRKQFIGLPYPAPQPDLKRKKRRRRRPIQAPATRATLD